MRFCSFCVGAGLPAPLRAEILAIAPIVGHTTGKASVPGSKDGGFTLRSATVGALPIVNALLDRLGIDDCLRQEAPADPRAKVAPAAGLGALLRNLIEARTPLYALREWAQERDPALLGLPQGVFAALNDDRVGRALDRLFDADRAALQTGIVVSAIKTFGIATDELHNDSTSITLHGRYADADGKTVRGQPTAAIRRGYNKDHRPDLKQLLWVLTVTADGAVPLHCRVLDGNTTDTDPHIEYLEHPRRPRRPARLLVCSGLQALYA